MDVREEETEVNIWTSEEEGNEGLIKLHNVQLHNLCVISNGGDCVKENQMGRICSNSSGKRVHFFGDPDRN